MTGGATSAYSLTGKRVWINGHGGMVATALARRLETVDCELLTTARGDLDLRRQADVEAWMGDARPDAVFLCAATVGGIAANEARQGEFLYDNLAIAANVIEGARRTRVEKLLFLSAACVYPREAPQPIAEESLLTGPLEPTNESSSVAKIAGTRLCQAYRAQYGCDFIAAQPVNLFGPGDDFDPDRSHVVAGLMGRAHVARMDGAETLVVWGSGTPKREFLYVDDAADALLFLMENYSGAMALNVGPGAVLTIRELAEAVAAAVGFEGGLAFDTSKPDGMPLKTLDTTRFRDLGWRGKTSFADGLARTYAWFLANVA